MVEKDTESTPSKTVVAAMEKARAREQAKIDAMTESSSMLGDVIPDETDTRTTEEKILGSGWEKAVAGSDLSTKMDPEIEVSGVTPEPSVVVEAKEASVRLRTPSLEEEMTKTDTKIDKEKVEFEKVKAEWREKRDEANKLEADYQQKYEAYIKEQSKGWGMVSTLPRRALGLQPKLSGELIGLKAKADSSRISFNAAAKELLTMSGNDVAERLNRRLLPKVAATLPLVHQRRLETQKQGLNQAWSESKYIRPTLETISKNKGTLTAVSLGIAAMTPVGVIPVLAAIGAGLVAGKGTLEIGNSLFVVPSRKKLAEARATVGDNFFEKSYREMDEAMEGMTFHVEAQEARIKTAAVSAGVLAGIAAGGYARGLGAVEQVTIGTPDTNLGTDTPSSTIPSSIIERTPFGTAPVETGADLPVADAPVGDSLVSSPEAEVTSEPDSVEESSGRAGSDSTGTRADRAPEPTIGRADGAASELPRSSGSGVERVDTNTEPLIKDKTVPEVEVAKKDYSLPPFSSVGDLPSTGIVESVPQAPTESITYTVEKGDNVWNILEGKGPDANPVGGKSEVLEGMSLSDRQAALDKLVEYAEQNPEFAKEVGAVKSNGDIHRIYPGEEINVSMLDDKLRELLSIGETAPEPVATPEAMVPAEEVGRVEVQPEPVAEQVVEEPEAAPEPVPVSPQPESSDAPVYESGPIINASMSSEGASSSVGEDAPITPEPMAANANEIAVNNYVAGVEKATGGFLDSIFGLSQPNVGGTFDLIKGVNLNDMLNAAQSGQILEGVNQAGWDRWADTLQKQVQLIPANSTETVGDYVTRIASTRIA